MKNKKLGFLFLAAVFVFVLALWITSEAQSFTATGNPLDTPYGTVISAPSSECTLDYTDVSANPKPQVNADSDILVTVAPEYGFSGIGAPADQSSPGSATPAYYTYNITNEGNASDTYYFSLDPLVYYGGATGWTAQIVSAETDDIISSAVVAEDADFTFRVKITPAGDALEGQSAEAKVNASSEASPIGQYEGGNGLTYGGTDEADDTTRTTITGAPTLTLTRTSTVDAPSGHISHGGDTHDPVPGAVVTYFYTYSNIGAGTAESNIIVDKVPGSTEGCHVNVHGAGKVPNVNVASGLAATTAQGWTVSTSEASSPSRVYGNTTDWTVIGTLPAPNGAAYATTEGFDGTYFFRGISEGTTYIKFEKQYIQSYEDNLTFRWGVTIR